MPASSCGAMPRRSAIAVPTMPTCAGSFGLPRWGTGARNGESVSTSMRSSGQMRAASRRSAAFLNVTMPLNDRYAPRSRHARASSGPPVKQWITVFSGIPSVSSTANVSSHASRVCTTSDTPCSRARWIWRANAGSCTSRGEFS